MPLEPTLNSTASEFERLRAGDASAVEQAFQRTVQERDFDVVDAAFISCLRRGNLLENASHRLVVDFLTNHANVHMDDELVERIDAACGKPERRNLPFHRETGDTLLQFVMDCPVSPAHDDAVALHKAYWEKLVVVAVLMATGFDAAVRNPRSTHSVLSEAVSSPDQSLVFAYLLRQEARRTVQQLLTGDPTRATKFSSHDELKQTFRDTVRLRNKVTNLRNRISSSKVAYSKLLLVYGETLGDHGDFTGPQAPPSTSDEEDSESDSDSSTSSSASSSHSSSSSGASGSSSSGSDDSSSESEQEMHFSRDTGDQRLVQAPNDWAHNTDDAGHSESLQHVGHEDGTADQQDRGWLFGNQAASSGDEDESIPSRAESRDQFQTSESDEPDSALDVDSDDQESEAEEPSRKIPFFRRWMGNNRGPAKSENNEVSILGDEALPEQTSYSIEPVQGKGWFQRRKRQLTQLLSRRKPVSHTPTSKPNESEEEAQQAVASSPSEREENPSMNVVNAQGQQITQEGHTVDGTSDGGSLGESDDVGEDHDEGSKGEEGEVDSGEEGEGDDVGEDRDERSQGEEGGGDDVGENCDERSRSEEGESDRGEEGESDQGESDQGEIDHDNDDHKSEDGESDIDNQSDHQSDHGNQNNQRDDDESDHHDNDNLSDHHNDHRNNTPDQDMHQVSSDGSSRQDQDDLQHPRDGESPDDIKSEQEVVEDHHQQT